MRGTQQSVFALKDKQTSQSITQEVGETKVENTVKTRLKDSHVQRGNSINLNNIWKSNF